MEAWHCGQKPRGISINMILENAPYLFTRCQILHHPKSPLQPPPHVHALTTCPGKAKGPPRKVPTFQTLVMCQIWGTGRRFGDTQWASVSPH